MCVRELLGERKVHIGVSMRALRARMRSRLCANGKLAFCVCACACVCMCASDSDNTIFAAGFFHSEVLCVLPMGHLLTMPMPHDSHTYTLAASAPPIGRGHCALARVALRRRRRVTLAGARANISKVSRYHPRKGPPAGISSKMRVKLARLIPLNLTNIWCPCPCASVPTATNPNLL